MGHIAVIGDVWGDGIYPSLNVGGHFGIAIDATAASFFEGNICPPLDASCAICYDFITGAFGFEISPRAHAREHGWLL